MSKSSPDLWSKELERLVVVRYNQSGTAGYRSVRLLHLIVYKIHRQYKYLLDNKSVN